MNITIERADALKESQFLLSIEKKIRKRNAKP